MREPTRAAATATAVLILLGAVAWATAPVLVLLHELIGRSLDDHVLRGAALVAGCLIGGAVAARVLPTVPTVLLVAAATLAGGAVLGMRTLPELSAPALTAPDLVTLALALAATAASATLGARLPRALGQLAAAAFVQLAVVTAALVTLAQLGSAGIGSESARFLGGLAALVVGGAVTVRLVPGATVGQIAMSWLALAATTILAMILMSSERMVILFGALATAFVLPFPIALSAVGAAIARPRGAAPDLPDAVARPGR